MRRQREKLPVAGSGLPLMKTITASESKGLALVSVRLITDCAPWWMPNEAPDDASAARRTRGLFVISIIHYLHFCYTGCHQFAAYVTVWKEHAPLLSALSIKSVCLIRTFYSFVWTLKKTAGFIVDCCVYFYANSKSCFLFLEG